MIGLDVTGSIASFLETVLLVEDVPDIAVNRAAHDRTPDLQAGAAG